jgi:CubicO group peptidase (beta-lactamase class C family)
MSAGMATDDPWADRHLDATAEFMNEVYANGVHFAGRTGELFEYSNLGFAMIGRVVRTVTGRDVRDHVDERLLGPLGMTHTSWERPRGAVAEPHRLRDGVAVRDDVEPLGDGEIAPMGGLWSTVDDLVRWMAWLDGANDDADWLRASSRREMQRIQNYFGSATLDGAAAPSGYGFGLLVRDDPTIGMVAGHSGGLPGYGSNMRWKRGAGVGVVGLANITYAPMSTFTHRALLALAQGGHAGVETSPVDPLLLERAHALVALFERWDDEAARSLFADNVALDEALDRRRADTDSWVQGRALRVITVTSSCRTSGTIEVAAGDSRFDIDFSLSPHRALVQTWSWRKRS